MIFELQLDGAQISRNYTEYTSQLIVKKKKNSSFLSSPSHLFLCDCQEDYYYCYYSFSIYN